MSINEERMLILKMLEDKKITSEEAEKLLASLGDQPRQQEQPQYNNGTRGQRNNNGFADEAAKVRDRVNEWRKSFQKNYNQADFDNMIDDFANKAEKIGKNVASTTFGMVDKVIDYVGSFVDTNAFNAFGSFQVVQKNYEVEPAQNATLEISGVNGTISIKRHMNPKIIIVSRIRCSSPNIDNVVTFNDNPSAVSLKVNSTVINMSVSHEILLPDMKFESIKIENSNGKIYIEDASANEISAVTKNAHIELMGVNSNNITTNTKNGRIQLSYTVGDKIDINTCNAVVDIKHVKAQDINAITINGRISIENAQNIENSNLMNMYLKTSNGGIKINMNDMDNRVYKVKANARNGSINLLIPDIVYNSIDRKGVTESVVEAVSKDFEEGISKVNVTAETFNGHIEVVK